MNISILSYAVLSSFLFFPPLRASFPQSLPRLNDFPRFLLPARLLPRFPLVTSSFLFLSSPFFIFFFSAFSEHLVEIPLFVFTSSFPHLTTQLLPPVLFLSLFFFSPFLPFCLSFVSLHFPPCITYPSLLSFVNRFPLFPHFFLSLSRASSVPRPFVLFYTMRYL